MFKIDRENYGYKLTFSGTIKADEMEQWVEESKKELASQAGKFGVFVDMRNLKPLDESAQKKMEAGQKLYKQKGMERSVVVLDSALLTMQFKRIAKETGIYDWERYINAAVTPNWEEVGINWITKGVDPDK